MFGVFDVFRIFDTFSASGEGSQDTPVYATDVMLLENGNRILLETGDGILLESIHPAPPGLPPAPPPVDTYYVVTSDGNKIMTASGSYIVRNH
jgi:hypothetical protein